MDTLHIFPFDEQSASEPYGIYVNGDSSAFATGSLAWCVEERERIMSDEDGLRRLYGFDGQVKRGRFVTVTSGECELRKP